MSLPSDWDLRRLDDVADVRLGRQRSPKNHAGSQMRPYLRAANVGWSGIRLDDVKEMNFTDDEMATYRLLPGDIVLSEASGSPDEVGKPAIWLGQIDECAFQNTLLRVRPHSLEPRYLLHFFSYLAQSGAFARKSRGVGIHHIGRAALAEWPIPIPPISQQRRIVEILEDHLSRLDASDTLIHGVRRRSLALRASGRRQAFDHLLRHGVATERALLEVAVIANGQTPNGLNDLAVAPDAESVPFFKVGDMNASGGRYMSTARTYLSRLGIKELGLAVRPSGTVLIPKRGGAIATNKKRILSSAACYDLNTMGLIPGPELLGEYLWHWLETVDLGRLADGSNVPQINAPQIRALGLPIPPLDEQRRLVEKLDDLDGAVGRLGASLSGARSTALRRALLTAAFSGRLTGRTGIDEDVEEPASD